MKTALTFCRILITLSVLVLVVQAGAFAASIDSELGENETKMGKEGVAEIAKEHKISDNAADLKRVREMGAKLAEIANKKTVDALYGSARITPFEYTFNIIEEKDVNAFSMPGGFIYVYRGLLDFVESDQELAAILAHEVAHASHHHMVFLLRKQASLNNAMAIALLAAMLSGARSADVGNVLLGAQLYQIAKLNGYGMQAERDSDNAAVLYARDAGYNPVGLITFLERLAKRPELVDYGIYRSHPLDADRIKAARKLIQNLGLQINRRDTTKAIKAEVKTEKVDGADIPGVFLKDTLIYRPAPLDGKTPEQRAQDTAERINKMLDAGPKMHEIKADARAGGVIAKGQALIVVSDADAVLMKKTPAQVATAAAAVIRDVVWKEMVDTVH